MKYDLLGLYIEEFSIRNKNLENQNVYSVTNSEGFIRSTDFFNKVVFSKDLANYKVVLPNYFAYNPSRLNVGSIDFLSSSDGVIVSPLYVIFKCNDLLFSEYLKRYLKSKTGQMQIKSKTKGAVRDTVSFSSLAEMRIPIPPLADQIHIAHILSQAEALIAQRKESIRLLDELVKSKFLEMFGDPVKNEKGWEVKRLKDVIYGIDSGWSPVCEDYSRSIESEKAILKLGSVTKCKFDPTANKKLPEELEEKKLIEVKDGDVLFTRKNTKELVAAACYVFKTPCNLFLSDLIFRLNYNSDLLNGIYLSNLITEEKYRKQIQSLATGSAGSMPNISKEKLMNFYTLVPPISIQNKFAEFVENIQLQKIQYQRSLIDLETLYSSLSQKAFNGELTANQKSSSTVSAPWLARETSLHVIATDSNKERTTLQKIDKIKAAFSSKKEEQSFLKRKILGSYIINQSLEDSQFGDVKFEKLLHLSEYLILKRNFGQHYVQKVAGPYDNKFTILFFQQIEKDRWFRRIKEGKQFHFQKGEKHESSTKIYNYFSEEELGFVQSLIQLFKKANYEKVEVVSTLYAVWNNRIIKGEPIEDNLLKEDFLNWDSQKTKYKDRLDNAIVWMREKNLVPDGWGPLIEKTK
ncbi:restriction endonuclease subunit S [Leptospira interrogans]|uniref:restriction endonuclease subunit S n=1 Tax=Leptospira interrogans TaxID=173 RepID=UPI00029291B3|nr:restriction endonuclease subunit S [Leptospira interrogans]ASV05581.1 type I restriction endonuclease subunit S [Leptospira interrogans serovar Canicola]ASV08980.1 type I restriction endonuclease subunit S [Leptospira interrogans serovar Canicola]EKO70633.1 type I restriction modification DNA specificity domain protein [Leptospira interrogans serovar Canicola str. Fiocruz LV133]EMK23380.1 type I restriction modification DNA specificity domain protein [Leptospira interrogans str. Kito]EMN773